MVGDFFFTTIHTVYSTKPSKTFHCSQGNSAIKPNAPYMFCNKDHIVLRRCCWVKTLTGCCVGITANTAGYLSLQGLRDIAGVWDLLIKLISACSHMCHCLSVERSQVLLSDGICSLWNSPLYVFLNTEYHCCLCSSLLFTLPFTFKSHSMNCLWTFLSPQLLPNDCLLYTGECVLVSMLREKQRYFMEEVEDIKLMHLGISVITGGHFAVHTL